MAWNLDSKKDGLVGGIGRVDDRWKLAFRLHVPQHDFTPIQRYVPDTPASDQQHTCPPPALHAPMHYIIQTPYPRPESVTSRIIELGVFRVFSIWRNKFLLRFHVGFC